MCTKYVVEYIMSCFTDTWESNGCLVNSDVSWIQTDAQKLTVRTHVSWAIAIPSLWLNSPNRTPLSGHRACSPVAPPRPRHEADEGDRDPRVWRRHAGTRTGQSNRGTTTIGILFQSRDNIKPNLHDVPTSERRNCENPDFSRSEHSRNGRISVSERRNCEISLLRRSVWNYLWQHSRCSLFQPVFDWSRKVRWRTARSRSRGKPARWRWRSRATRSSWYRGVVAVRLGLIAA